MNTGWLVFASWLAFQVRASALIIVYTQITLYTQITAYTQITVYTQITICQEAGWLLCHMRDNMLACAPLPCGVLASPGLLRAC